MKNHKLLIYAKPTIFFIIIILSSFFVYFGKGSAAYRVERPISNGQVNQYYLYAEEDSAGNTHRGIDIPAPVGTNVYALEDGIVSDYIESYPRNSIADGGFGNFILIKHSKKHFIRQNNGTEIGINGFVYSIYAHLDENGVHVSLGQTVTAGQYIGSVDSTGNSTGHHLHVQIVLDPSGAQNDGNNYGWVAIRSRNPELWLAPYNGNTARVIGKITSPNGSPRENVMICGMAKPYGNYGFSRTYSYSWANPDDIYNENFGTTDITPGTWRIIAYEYQGPDSVCGSSPVVQDFGWHTVTAGETSFIGLYPVYLPGIQSSTSANEFNATIAVRNNSTTKHAEVSATIFYSSGTVKEQTTHVLGPNETIHILPTGNFTGSALIVGSEDISANVVYERGNPESYGAYAGIKNPSYLAHVSIAHRNNYGWYSRLRIFNTGNQSASITVKFYPWEGTGNACTKTYSSAEFSLLTVSFSGLSSCVGSKFVGSVFIVASQPVAVSWEQYKVNSPELLVSGMAGGTADQVFTPLIQNHNFGWISGISAQNASSTLSSILINYRKSIGTLCEKLNFPNTPARNTAIDLSPPGTVVCTPVSSAVVTGTGPITANVNQLLPGTAYATDYPGITSPSPRAVLSWVRENNDWTPGILIQNLGSQATTVKIYFYNSNGALNSVVNTPSLQPNRLYSYLGVPGAFYFQGSAVVEAGSNSSSPIAVTINHLKSGGTNKDLLMTYIGDSK